MIQLQFPDIQMPTIPDYSNRLDEINNKIDKLYAEMGKFATAMVKKLFILSIVNRCTKMDTNFTYLKMEFG